MTYNPIMAKKTWTEKLNRVATYQIKTIDKKFADIPEGSTMLIATPGIIDDYIKKIPAGEFITLPIMRSDLALEYGAQKTCPVSTGIFLRIAAEAAYEQYLGGVRIEKITPFWRIIDEKMPVAKKLTCGIDFIKKQRAAE